MIELNLVYQYIEKNGNSSSTLLPFPIVSYHASNSEGRPGSTARLYYFKVTFQRKYLKDLFELMKSNKPIFYIEDEKLGFKDAHDGSLSDRAGNTLTVGWFKRHFIDLETLSGFALSGLKYDEEGSNNYLNGTPSAKDIEDRMEKLSLLLDTVILPDSKLHIKLKGKETIDKEIKGLASKGITNINPNVKWPGPTPAYLEAAKKIAEGFELHNPASLAASVKRIAEQVKDKPYTSAGENTYRLDDILNMPNWMNGDMSPEKRARDLLNRFIFQNSKGKDYQVVLFSDLDIDRAQLTYTQDKLLRYDRVYNAVEKYMENHQSIPVSKGVDKNLLTLGQLDMTKVFGYITGTTGYRLPDGTGFIIGKLHVPNWYFEQYSGYIDITKGEFSLLTVGKLDSNESEIVCCTQVRESGRKYLPIFHQYYRNAPLAVPEDFETSTRNDLKEKEERARAEAEVFMSDSGEVTEVPSKPTLTPRKGKLVTAKPWIVYDIENRRYQVVGRSGFATPADKILQGVLPNGKFRIVLSSLRNESTLSSPSSQANEDALIEFINGKSNVDLSEFLPGMEGIAFAGLSNCKIYKYQGSGSVITVDLDVKDLLDDEVYDKMKELPYNFTLIGKYIVTEKPRFLDMFNKKYVTVTGLTLKQEYQNLAGIVERRDVIRRLRIANGLESDE